MRFSLQSASIIFGVTLVHLFVIAAVSPVEGEWAETLPKIEIDPAVESLFDEAVTVFKGDENTETVATSDASAEPVFPIRENNPAEEIAPGEMADLRINPAAAEGVQDAPSSPPAKDLAEIASEKEALTGSDDAPALEAPRQVRQIRSLQPIPRS